MPPAPYDADSAHEFPSTQTAIKLSQSGLTMSKGPTTPGTARRKGSTTSAPPATMKRAASTPNVRLTVGDDSSAAFLAEKRRNKLGYHRTSVACGQLAGLLVGAIVAD